MKLKIFMLLAGVGLLWALLNSLKSGVSQPASVRADSPSVPVPAASAPQTPLPPPATSAPLQQFSEQLLSPPYSQPVTAMNLAQTEAPSVAAVTVPLDDGIVWSLQPGQFRFSYPEPVTATVQIKGEQPAFVRYRLRSTATAELLSSGELAADADGLFRLSIPGHTDFPAELELIVDSEPGHGALALLQYHQPVAWLAQTLALHADDSDLVLPLQLEVQQRGLYRVQAVLGQNQQQSAAKPLAILQGEFMLEAGTATIELRAHHSVLPAEPFDAELSRLQLELAPPVPGAATGYGRPLQAPVALGDFDPRALNRTPYQPDAQALKRVELLQQLGR